jgi:hypothetical protein
VVCSWYLFLIISWQPALQRQALKNKKNHHLTRTTEKGRRMWIPFKSSPPFSSLAFIHTKPLRFHFFFICVSIVSRYH